MRLNDRLFIFITQIREDQPWIRNCRTLDHRMVTLKHSQLTVTKFFHTLNPLSFVTHLIILITVPSDQCWFPQKIPTYSASSKGYWTPEERFGKFPDSTKSREAVRRIGMTHVAKLLFNGIHIHQRNPTTGDYQFYPGVPRCALDLSHL